MFHNDTLGEDFLDYIENHRHNVWVCILHWFAEWVFKILQDCPVTCKSLLGNFKRDCISRQALKTMLPKSNTNGVCLYSHTLNSWYFNMYFPLVLRLTGVPHLCLTDSPLSVFYFLFIFYFFQFVLNNVTSDYLSLFSTTIILISNYRYTVIW